MTSAAHPVPLPPAFAVDPRLLTPSDIDAALTASALPLGNVGALTVIATADGQIDPTERTRLEHRFGRIAIAKRQQRWMDAVLTDYAGQDLANRAEQRPAAANSCRSWSGARTARWGLSALIALGLGATFLPRATILTLTIWAVITLLSVTLLRCAAAVAAWRGKGLTEIDKPELADADLPVISVLVPLFRERDIATRLVRRIGALDYPEAKLDVILVLEDDDAETARALASTDLPPHFRALSVPQGSIRTKPRALNFAMDFARGTIIAVYDAEDWPAPDQLRKVAQRFHEAGPKVACLQGVLEFYNARQNWLTRCFAIDYATWFGLILPGLARLGLVIPLGGTTLFFRADILRRLGYWDAHNVTEDADLGIRLARHGYRTEILATCTSEEATSTVPTWIKQRSRWIKGYALTWAVHMRNPVRILLDLGLWRFLGFQILFLGTLSHFLLAPLLWSFWLVVFGLSHPFTSAAGPVAIWTVTVLFFAAEILTIAINAVAVSAPRHRWLIPWVPVMHLYFPLAALASWKGFYELVQRPFYWDKTRHGQARQAPPPAMTAGD